MTNERLEQIRDSVDFQLEMAELLKIDKEVILEEKELLDEIDRLREINGNAIEYIQNEIQGNYFKRYDDEVYKMCEDLLNILNGNEELLEEVE